MSKIKETRTVTQEVTVAWECDVCGAYMTDLSKYEREWYHFSKSHQGWGNDSLDSYDEYDVCSVDCFMKCLEDRLPDLSEYADDDAEIADMPVRFAQKLLESLKGKEGKNG